MCTWYLRPLLCNALFCFIAGQMSFFQHLYALFANDALFESVCMDFFRVMPSSIYPMCLCVVLEDLVREQRKRYI